MLQMQNTLGAQPFLSRRTRGGAFELLPLLLHLPRLSIIETAGAIEGHCSLPSRFASSVHRRMSFEHTGQMMEGINPNRALSFVPFTTLLPLIRDDAAPGITCWNPKPIGPVECDKDYRLRKCNLLRCRSRLLRPVDVSQRRHTGRTFCILTVLGPRSLLKARQTLYKACRTLLSSSKKMYEAMQPRPEHR